MSGGTGTLRAEVRITFASEYHVGAGHGLGGGIDSALFTETLDGVEVPAIRYGHGVLRQALYDLLQAPVLHALRRCKASGLAGGRRWCTPRHADDGGICPVCRIFGSPALPSPWSFSTLWPAEQEGDGPVPHAGARVVSRASIDPRRRRAADKTLFSEELGAPLAFAMTAERTPGAGENGLDELALLAAAARSVPALGADRRRGRGECVIDVSAPGLGADRHDLLLRFQDAWIARDNDTPPRALKAAIVPRLGVARADVVPSLWDEAREANGTRQVRLVLRLDEPVIAGQRPLTGNVLESELFIPGSVLLGALAARALARGGHEEESALLRAFRAGGVRFPDLLPVAPVGNEYVPSLPAPRDLFTCSRHRGPPAVGGHGVWSALADNGGPACRVCRETGIPDAKPERVKGYLAPLHENNGETRWTLDLAPREETKIEVDPRTGRVRETSLYHRQMIPAGTLMAGVLFAATDALADLSRWLDLGDGDVCLDLRLGKRHSRGYGAARLAWLPVPEQDAEARRSAIRRRVTALVDSGAPIPLVATSRVLLRDPLGRVQQHLAPEDLGLPGKGRCAVAVDQVGGYWRHIGLPRQQEVALEPGSVLIVTLNGPGRERLIDGLVALADGRAVGERTAEGFGRFAVAPFPYAWDGDAAGPADPDFQLKPVPESLSVRAASLGTGALRRNVRSDLAREYGEKLEGAGIDPTRDEWRTIARLLYARAGDVAGPLIDAIEKGSGAPLRVLTAPDLEGSRTAKSFVGKDGAGHDAWKHVCRAVKEAASDARENVRALQTRALADAVALIIQPAKGRE